MNMIRFTRASIALSCSLLIMHLGSATPQERRARVHDVEEYSIELTDRQVVGYEIGTLRVPENRSDPTSRMIGVGYARVRCSSKERACPPVFVLPGGPGASLVDRIQAGDPKRRNRSFNSYARFRHLTDVVLVDQRGFTARGDVIEVQEPFLIRPVGRPTTVSDQVVHAERFARAIVEQYQDSEVDLRGYTIVECAHDVHDLCAALGYDQVILEGTSFGSQWSFAIMRLFPDLVARALLSGVEPIDHGYDMPRHVFAALQRIWAEIDEDPRFQAYLPEGGMGQAARTVIEDLERAPIVIQGRSGGKPVAWLGPYDFPWRQPARILALYHRHYAPWQRAAERDQDDRTRTQDLIGFLIDSSSGTTAERRAQLWNDPAVRYISSRNFAPLMTTASVWPTEDVGDALRRPVLCTIPVLFAHGDWDLKTPLENTLEIAPYFPHGRVLIAKRGGHGVLGPIRAQQPEVWAQIEEFIRTGDLEDVPATVRLSPSRSFEPPSFRVRR